MYLDVILKGFVLILNLINNLHMAAFHLLHIIHYLHKIYHKQLYQTSHHTWSSIIEHKCIVQFWETAVFMVPGNMIVQ